MGARDDQLLIEKLKSLSPQRRAEVEDFVDFLKSREDEQRLTHAAAQASKPSFKSVWDNSDDADYGSGKPHESTKMPDQIDFSGGTRGKFCRADATLNLPVHLESEVQTRLAKLASDRGIDFSTLVNETLRKGMERIEMAK